MAFWQQAVLVLKIWSGQKNYREFYRMWKYDLLTSAAGFRVGYNQLWQMVYSKQPVSKVYEGVRSPEIAVSRTANVPADSRWNWLAPQVNRSVETAALG